MTIFKHVMKRIFSSKIKLAVIFLCPVLFTAIFMSVSSSTMTILLVDNDNSALSQALAERLQSMDSKVKVEISDESAIDDKVLCYQADEAVIIPKGFEAAILSGGNAAVEEFYILEVEGIYYVRAFINGFVSDMKALAGTLGNGEAFTEAFDSYKRDTLSVHAPLAEDTTILVRTYSSLGFIVQFMLYMSIITAGIVLEDKSSGVYYRTFFAPVSLKRYYTENLLAFLAIGILQAAVSLTMLMLVFGMGLVDPVAIFALFAVFTLVCISLGMWVITLFRKPLMAYLSIMFLVTPLVMLGGCYWPASYMPDMIIKIAKFMPTSWVMQAVDKVLNGGADLGGIMIELLVLLLFAGVFFAAGLAKKVEISK